MPETMRAAVFKDVRDIHIEEVPVPRCGPTDAIVKITTTTICGTDSHIWRGEYPVAPGRVVGHEPAGVIHEVGESVAGYEVGDRVVVGAITPCGTCYFCQSGDFSQCAGYEDQWGIIGGWRLGNSMDGVQAEYFRVPYAQANLARIPEGLSDEEVLFVTDIATTGIAAVETADVQLGDSVVVFAQGPIGLCATAGARLRGAGPRDRGRLQPRRLEMARTMGADVIIDYTQEDPVAKVKALTEGRGADVAIEALGIQETFENCLKSVRPAGVVSSLGVYGDKVDHPARAVHLRHRRHRHPHHALPRRQEAPALADEPREERPPQPAAAHHAPLRPRRHRGGLLAVLQPGGRRDQGDRHPVRHRALVATALAVAALAAAGCGSDDDSAAEAPTTTEAPATTAPATTAPATTAPETTPPHRRRPPSPATRPPASRCSWPRAARDATGPRHQAGLRPEARRQGARGGRRSVPP